MEQLDSGTCCTDRPLRAHQCEDSPSESPSGRRPSVSKSFHKVLCKFHSKFTKCTASSANIQSPFQNGVAHPELTSVSCILFSCRTLKKRESCSSFE